VPLRILNENSSKEEYERFLKDIHTFKFEKWLETKKEDFLISFPEYLPKEQDDEV
jgi:hypothetical protein